MWGDVVGEGGDAARLVVEDLEQLAVRRAPAHAQRRAARLARGRDHGVLALRAQGDDVLALLLGGRARVRARVRLGVRVRVRARVRSKG